MIETLKIKKNQKIHSGENLPCSICQQLFCMSSLFRVTSDIISSKSVVLSGPNEDIETSESLVHGGPLNTLATEIICLHLCICVCVWQNQLMLLNIHFRYSSDYS